MTRRTFCLMCVAAIVLSTIISVGSAAAAPSGSVTPLASDDNIPGDPIVPSGTRLSLDSASDTDDVFRVWLTQGETLRASIALLGSSTAGFSPEIALYAPSATNLSDQRTDFLVISQEFTFPRTISYVAPASGYYYLDIYQSRFPEPAESGEVVLNWSVSHPVYRFYNSRLGTHFYTASEDERARVIATLSNTYQFEGTAYNTDPYTNAAPLYRFYRPSTGTHFYTANESEKNSVIARLSGTYTFEGAAYTVSLAPSPGALTVWRFYNFRNGTHFYTANEAEMNNVIATLGGTYTFEGPAFYVAP